MSAPAAANAATATAAPMPDASQLPVIRVGGVPEHFNLPWHLAQERGLFAAAGVRVQWCEYPLGTGAMIAALQAGEVDLIVALSEGLIAAIARGGALRLIGTYVESPLRWAISTGANSRFHDVSALRGETIGVSRMTSGSHLMSCVLATQRGWAQSDLKYEVQGSFEALRRGVNEGTTAAFMWETFTTKPFHDSGEIRRIGEITTPWSCFLLASSLSVLASEPHVEALKRVRSAVQRACELFRTEENMAALVAQRYGLRVEDAREWYASVRITAADAMQASTILQPLQALRDAGILPPAAAPAAAAAASAEQHDHDDPSAFIDARFIPQGVQSDIRSNMALYHRPELLVALRNNIRVRIGKESAETKLDYKELLPYDENHYGGVEALEACVRSCGLKQGSRVLQMGSSVGGPARFLAAAHGCEVLAIELQEPLHAAAVELTTRCGLEQLVRHTCGPMLQVAPSLSSESFDCIASWLTQLHFSAEERPKLFGQALRLLRPGGVLYAEDFFERAPFSAEEKRTLKEEVFCNYTPSLEQYKSELQRAGFEVVAVEDLSAEWIRLTRERAEQFDAAREENVRVHGAALVESMSAFYSKIARLFEGGHCGGVRLVCRKPLSATSISAQGKAGATA